MRQRQRQRRGQGDGAGHEAPSGAFGRRRRGPHGPDETPLVTVYWRPGCPHCARLRLRLRLAGIPTTEVDIWEDPSAAAIVRSMADGNETVPTVVVGGRAFVNPSVRTVRRALAAGGADHWRELGDLLGGRPGWRLEAMSTPGRPPAWCFQPSGDPELTVTVEGGSLSVYVAEADLELTCTSAGELADWLHGHWPGALPERRERLADRLHRDRFFRWD